MYSIALFNSFTEQILAELKWVNEKLVTSQLLGDICYWVAEDKSFLLSFCGNSTLGNGSWWCGKVP